MLCALTDYENEAQEGQLSWLWLHLGLNLVCLSAVEGPYHHRKPLARRQESPTHRCGQTSGECGGGWDRVPGREAAQERDQWGGAYEP